MTEHDTFPLAWRRSSLSRNGTECVEAAALPARQGVAIRDSKDADGPRLAVDHPAWNGFVAAVRDENKLLPATG